MGHHFSLGDRLERNDPVDHGDAMSGEVRPMVVVAGSHVIEIRADRSGGPRSMIVSVELDHERSWLFDEPGWQDLAVGVAEGVAYWRSARHVVVLPSAPHDEPVVISADEDIRRAFMVTGCWLLVCETSVRLLIEGQEVSRLEFGEVLLVARWEGAQLVVRDAAGQDFKVVVSERRLTYG